MGIEEKQPQPGDMVVLVGLPPGFLGDLPLENQKITRWGYAELEFPDSPGKGHFLYVDLSFIRAVKSP